LLAGTLNPVSLHAERLEEALAQEGLERLARGARAGKTVILALSIPPGLIEERDEILALKP